MAHFRAVIKGARGEASRLGTKKSGISALVQTWGKDVSVQVNRTNNGEDWARVYIAAHGSDPYHGELVWEGRVG